MSSHNLVELRKLGMRILTLLGSQERLYLARSDYRRHLNGSAATLLHRAVPPVGPSGRGPEHPSLYKHPPSRRAPQPPGRPWQSFPYPRQRNTERTPPNIDSPPNETDAAPTSTTGRRIAGRKRDPSSQPKNEPTPTPPPEDHEKKENDTPGSQEERSSESESDNKEKDKEKANKESQNSFNPRSPVFASAALFLSLCLLLSFVDIIDKGEEISLQEFLARYLSNNEVAQITVYDRTLAVVDLKPATSYNRSSQARSPDPHKLSESFAASEMKHFPPLQSNQASSWPPQEQLEDPLASADKSRKMKRVHFNIGSVEAFEHRLQAHQAMMGVHPNDFTPVIYKSREKEEAARAQTTWIVSTVITALIIGAAVRAAGAGFGDMLKHLEARQRGFRNTPSYKANRPTTRFADVAGLEEPKRELAEFVDFLRKPEKYAQLGARIPRGALMEGPPGTGKTLLARAVAGEANVPFFSLAGSDFVEMFVGVGAMRVRGLFAAARKAAPSIIFIDEIDSIGRHRARGGRSNEERENTLNQLLVEMDGFTQESSVVVLAGTNRADLLDEALKRAGRFDRSIAISRPTLKEREEIFRYHLRPVKVHEDFSVAEISQRLAALTPGFVGADISNICNEAAIQAARRESRFGVNLDDFERAVERVMAGLPKTAGYLSNEEKNIVAHHEAGHAVAGWLLPLSDPVLKVTICPRSSGALGFAQYLPDEVSLHSREKLLDDIAMTLAGRVAEDLFLDSISTGASNDLEKVTNAAMRLVMAYGFNSEVGLVSYHTLAKQEGFHRPYSEHTAMMIDHEVRKILDEQYARTKALLSMNRDKVLRLKDVLMEKETVVYKELEDILGPRPADASKSFIGYVSSTGRKVLDALKDQQSGSGDGCEPSRGSRLTSNDDDTQTTHPPPSPTP